jgi:hypothetical protein
MCDNRLSTREHEYMPMDKLQKVVDEIERIGANSKTAPTGVCGDGEAVYHPEFEKAVKIVSEKLHWCFGSNCNAFDEDKARVVVENKPGWVNLSIDAFHMETMAKIRPGVSLVRAGENVRRFIDMVRVAKPWDRHLYIQFVVMKQNVVELPEWVDYWLSQIDGIPGFELHIKPVFKWPRLSDKDANSFYPSPPLPKLPDHPQIHIDNMLIPPIRPTCRLLWNFACVMSDGAYNPCCMCADDVWEVGNVFESSLIECHASVKMQEHRKLFEAKRYDLLPLCERCV